MNKQNMIAVILLASAVTAGVSFYAGMKYQQSKRGQFFTQMNGQGRVGLMMGNGNRGSQPAGRQGFRPVAGEIIRADDTSITVKLSDGSSKIIMLTGSTRINKAAEGSKTDLTIGTQVAVFGSENTDGSVTAQNVQIDPVRPSQ